jgi:hypothetical protein
MLSHISAMLMAQANRLRMKRILREIDEAKAAYAADARIPFTFTTGRIGPGDCDA